MERLLARSGRFTSAKANPVSSAAVAFAASRRLDALPTGALAANGDEIDWTPISDPGKSPKGRSVHRSRGTLNISSKWERSISYLHLPNEPALKRLRTSPAVSARLNISNSSISPLNQLDGVALVAPIRNGELLLSDP